MRDGTPRYATSPVGRDLRQPFGAVQKACCRLTACQLCQRTLERKHGALRSRPRYGRSRGDERESLPKSEGCDAGRWADQSAITRVCSVERDWRGIKKGKRVGEDHKDLRPRTVLIFSQLSFAGRCRSPGAQGQPGEKGKRGGCSASGLYAGAVWFCRAGGGPLSSRELQGPKNR